MSYASVIVADGPTVYYPLNETSGTIALDSSGNGKNGTLAGSITYSQTGPLVGDSTTALLFGATATLTIPSTVKPNTWSALTLEYWIKQTGGWQYFVLLASAAGIYPYLNGSPFYGSGSGDPIFDLADLSLSGTWQSATLGQFALYQKLLSPAQIAYHWATANGVANQVALQIGGQSATLAEDTWQLHLTADERQRFQATVLDYAGNTTYRRGQQVTVTDPTLGRLFAGVLIDDQKDKQATYPDATVEHQIDTADNVYFVGKRTSARQYTAPTYAATIVYDAVTDALATEGIVAPAVQKTITTQADWNTGTLSNAAATLNVGDGDLELFGSGGIISASYSSATDWNTGTLTNIQVNSGGDLSLIGFTRNWNDGNKSNQTLFGAGSPQDGIVNNQYALTAFAGKETRSRLDFAGNWQNFTLEVDVEFPNVSVVQAGVVYRTTAWPNSNDMGAYGVNISPTFIQLGYGTNSTSGTGHFTTIQTVSTSFLPNVLHRLKIVVSGNSHQVYVDGTLYITATDSTYPATGQIGLRITNPDSFTRSDLFDNFGVMATLSGTWQSVTTSINSVAVISTSIITWDQSLSAGGTVLVQTSINGGSTWQNAANGGFIPGLTPGTSGVGKSVTVKVTLSNTTATTMPDLKSLQWSVVAGYASSGTWVSPLVSLTPAGRIGASLVAWNASFPSAAPTLGVDISLDGGNSWTDVSNQNGGPIPGLNGQPDPTVDGFATNTSASYTAGIGYGGGSATWTFDPTNSRVVAANGASAVLLSNALTIGNVDVFVDMDEADAAGLVFDFSDPGDYYGLIVADNQAAVGTKNRMTLYKISGGVQSTLGTGTIAFQRGTYHRIRATNLDGVITCSFDGSTIITAVDSTPLPAGQVGLYQAGGLTDTYALRTFGPTLDLGITGGIPTVARWYQLWIQPVGDNSMGKTLMTRCRLATTDTTVTPQVLSLTYGVFGTTIGVGSLIPSADYRQNFYDKVFDDAVAKQSNYLWYVDQNKLLNARHRAAIPAPWILQSSTIASAVDLEADSNLGVTVANDLYRNRQTLQGVIYTGTFSNNFQGDGQTTSFTLSNPIAPGTMPTITLNTVAQKVGKKGTTGAQFYYADNDPVLAQDPGQTVLISSDRLAVTFTGTYSSTLTIDNTTAQTALAADEGGSGIVEAVEDVSSRNMTVAAATTYANQLLTRYCLDGRTLTFATYRNGLAVGQIANVFLVELGLFDTPMLILSIEVTMRQQPNGTVQYRYVVTASELANQGTWQKLLASSLLLI